MGKILAINISERKGVQKKEVESVMFKEAFGIIGDAHAGPGIRQVSFLADESIDKIRDKVKLDLSYGRFAENITTSGIDLYNLAIGTKLKLGKEVIIEITQIGKECHNDCEIKRLAGVCVMPKEGVFGIVTKGGLLAKGDSIVILN